ncbi:MAG TPA: hypothetical protein VJN18_26320 [Polyangiaceae bacterium]|nr:hypothetical protein [Polyangiaceae bacterium]
MIRSREVVAAALLGAVVTAACTTDHDQLTKQPKAGSSSGGKGGDSSGFGGFGNTGDVSSQGGRVNPDDEILGDSVLTITHGVVDAASVRLCFARLDADGASAELLGEPSAELGYGTSVVLTELEGLSFAEDAIQPWVLAGDFELLEGLDCTDAVALAVEEEAKVTPAQLPEPSAGGAGAGGEGGAAPEPKPPLEMPALRARPVAAIPPGSLDIGRSILMVLSGCMGGAWYVDTVDAAICGEQYATDLPTLQPVVVKLSRELSFNAVGLQGVNGSLAAGPVDIRSSGGAGSIALTFASEVSFGSIAPRPADVRFGAVELGVESPNHGLQAVGADGGVLLQDSWPNIRDASGLSEITESRTYTAILVGPNPPIRKKGWWNAATFVLVDNDPTRE